MAAVLARAALADSVEIFTVRCEARAYLWADNEIADLHEAVDELQASAVRDGLVAKLGQDEVQRILADAFASVRNDLPKSGDIAPDPIETAPNHDSVADVPISTLQAAEYLVELGDLERFRAWFDRHSTEERDGIYEHLHLKEARRCRSLGKK